MGKDLLVLVGRPGPGLHLHRRQSARREVTGTIRPRRRRACPAPARQPAAGSLSGHRG